MNYISTGPELIIQTILNTIQTKTSTTSTTGSPISWLEWCLSFGVSVPVFTWVHQTLDLDWIYGWTSQPSRAHRYSINRSAIILRRLLWLRLFYQIWSILRLHELGPWLQENSKPSLKIVSYKIPIWLFMVLTWPVFYVWCAGNAFGAQILFQARLVILLGEHLSKTFY